jgi:hypothetical protein
MLAAHAKPLVKTVPHSSAKAPASAPASAVAGVMPHSVATFCATTECRAFLSSGAPSCRSGAGDYVEASRQRRQRQPPFAWIRVIIRLASSTELASSPAGKTSSVWQLKAPPKYVMCVDIC